VTAPALRLASPSTAPAPRACRAVVSDPPGGAITLKLYLDAVALAEIEIDPASAVALAGDLIDAARQRLGRARVVDVDMGEDGRA
jgi:hypothetical protein